MLTRYEAEPACSDSHRCHILIYGWTPTGIQTMMQYAHRQRGSEAAAPILLSGMKAIG